MRHGRCIQKGMVLLFNILVVEDDYKLRQLICTVLNKNGFHSFSAVSGIEALDIIENKYIDLMVCDIMMPHMDGIELTTSLRDSNFTFPILMVTAKETFIDKKIGFQSGADDYMVKPIDINELLLRINALLRRAKIMNDRRLQIGNTVLDYDSLTVLINDEPFILPQKEFYLLFKLLSFPNKIFTRRQLIDEFWGIDSDSGERTIDVHINRLRTRFFEIDDFSIVTIRGLGYKAVNNHHE